jgi:hypothetical protein
MVVDSLAAELKSLATGEPSPTSEPGPLIPDIVGPLWRVLHDGIERFRGSEAACYRHVLFGQGQSVDHATKYGGWTFEPVPDEEPDA